MSRVSSHHADNTGAGNKYIGRLNTQLFSSEQCHKFCVPVSLFGGAGVGAATICYHRL